MKSRTRRKLRRFLRRAGWPMAYVALVAGCLTLFLASMHSCSDRQEPAPGTSVRIITTPGQ